MSYTGNDVIAKFRARFGDTSPATALALLNEAATEIFSAIPYRRKTVTVNLTSGVGQYPLGAGYAKVWSARYARSSAPGDFAELEPTSTDELDDSRAGWRSAIAGSPQAYYLSGDESMGGVIGLFPPPDTSTAGSYPVLLLEVSTIPTFTTGLEALPDVPFVLEAFADLMCLKRAKDAKLSDAAAWAQISNESIDRLAHLFWSRNPRKPQAVTPTVRQSRSWRGNRSGGVRS